MAGYRRGSPCFGILLDLDLPGDNALQCGRQVPGDMVDRGCLFRETALHGGSIHRAPSQGHLKSVYLFTLLPAVGEEPVTV